MQVITFAALNGCMSTVHSNIIPSGISRLRAIRAAREIWQFLTLREIARNPREI